MPPLLAASVDASVSATHGQGDMEKKHTIKNHASQKRCHYIALATEQPQSLLL